jgi:hypothetical protein
VAFLLRLRGAPVRAQEEQRTASKSGQDTLKLLEYGVCPCVCVGFTPREQKDPACPRLFQHAGHAVRLSNTKQHSAL